MSVLYRPQPRTQRLFLSANLFRQTSTGAPSSTNAPESVTNWLFDATASEILAFETIALPASWATVNVYYWWAATTTDAQTVKLTTQYKVNSFVAGQPLQSGASGGYQLTTATPPGVADQLVRTQVMTDVACTPGFFSIRPGRQATDAADLYPADIRFYGFELERAS